MGTERCLQNGFDFKCRKNVQKSFGNYKVWVINSHMDLVPTDKEAVW